MTNDLEATDAILDKDDYDIMFILKKGTQEAAHNIWRIWPFSFANRAANLQNQHAASTLPHIHCS